eukprot:4988785-Alexandrium_andersonii.AAC.1
MKAAVRGVRSPPEACPRPAHHTGRPKRVHTQPASHWHLWFGTFVLLRMRPWTGLTDYVLF